MIQKRELNQFMMTKTRGQKTIQEEWDIWLERQIECLRGHEFDKLDLANVIGELEDLGKEQRNACKSFCRQIIVYFLHVTKD